MRTRDDALYAYVEKRLYEYDCVTNVKKSSRGNARTVTATITDMNKKRMLPYKIEGVLIEYVEV